MIRDLEPMNPLAKFFQENHQLSKDELGFIEAHFDKHIVPKGTILFEQGMVVGKVFFIADGILHHYNYTDQGEKITLNLHDGPCFCTDLESFTTGKPTEDSCAALIDCVLFVITKENYEELVNANLKWSNVAKDIIEKHLIMTMDQLKAASIISVEQRYLELVKTKPLIVQNATVADIASYLGTSRETLHRIRKKNIFIS